MVKLSRIRLLIFGIIVLSLFLGLNACKKKESVTEGIKTVADKPLPFDGFKAEINVLNPPSSLKLNSVANIPVKIKNTSNSIWPAKVQPGGAYAIGLAYHWLDKDGKVIIWDGLRTHFPHDIKPDEEVTLNAKVKSPDKPGDYILEFDMVQERVTWFSKKGDTKAVRLAIKVD